MKTGYVPRCHFWLSDWIKEQHCRNPPQPAKECRKRCCSGGNIGADWYKESSKNGLMLILHVDCLIINVLIRAKGNISEHLLIYLFLFLEETAWVTFTFVHYVHSDNEAS